MIQSVSIIEHITILTARLFGQSTFLAVFLKFKQFVLHIDARVGDIGIGFYPGHDMAFAHDGIP